jgi:hypothetical protein
MTCYDLRFPELARSLADAGAQVLLVCSSWVLGEHKTEQWLALNAARAIENSVYVAGVCQTPPVSVGRSVLVDPMGVVEADLGLEPSLRTVGISVETVDRVRESFPMFRHRRLKRQSSRPRTSHRGLRVGQGQVGQPVADVRELEVAWSGLLGAHALGGLEGACGDEDAGRMHYRRWPTVLLCAIF